MMSGGFAPSRLQSMSAGGYGAALRQTPWEVADMNASRKRRKSGEPDQTHIHVEKNNGPEEDATAGVAPFELEICLEFRDLTYTVMNKRKMARCPRSLWKWMSPCLSRSDDDDGGGDDDEKQKERPAPLTRNLLQGISGKARDGEVMAVMGPSGSGKSTLIDALAQRISRKSLHGSITLNGQEVDPDLLRNISAYVMQDDLLFPMLTVKETLMFSANVRLPASHTKEAKVERVDSLIRQLGLEKVADTIIGDEAHRGVSGGERRRVSIGIDIVHGPLLLFLDEPTSGLDSTSAHMVVQTLKHIAQMGSIIIFSIHQPSDRILRLIDNLVFLANGQMIYVGHPKDLTSYFTEFNHGYPIPSAHGNAAEFALDLIQVLNSMPDGIKPLVDRYKNVSHHKLNLISSQEPATSKTSLHPAIPTGVAGAIAASIAKGRLMSTSGYVEHCNDSTTLILKFANTRWYEIRILIWRGITNIRRTPELFYTRLATVTISGILLATIFWQLDKTTKGLQERLGFFAFAMSFTYYSCVDTLPIFLQERYIFIRETTHNAYRKSSYVLANALIYIPFLGILSLAFAVTTFWAVGLSGGISGFVFFFLVIWASFWAGNSFATFLSAIIPNVILGYTIVVAVLAYFLLLSGFFRTRDRIPKYWIWFHYISLIKYPYEAVVRNELMASAASSCFETAGQIFAGTPLAMYIPQTTVNILLETLRANNLSGTPFATLKASTCMIDGPAVLKNQAITQLVKSLIGCLQRFRKRKEADMTHVVNRNYVYTYAPTLRSITMRRNHTVPHLHPISTSSIRAFVRRSQKKTRPENAKGKKIFLTHAKLVPYSCAFAFHFAIAVQRLSDLVL